MKLSAAILLGSTLRKQCFRDLFRDGGSCAMGAAFEAIGADRLFPLEGTPWRWLLVASLRCPECGVEEPWVTIVITSHLNDKHRWSRERIAEWVATVEPQDIQGEQADEERGASTAVLEATEA
jgi:hypothetical protein